MPESPLSPHLQIYKWQITMALSILHRATGVFLSLGALGLAYWLLCIASGPEIYDGLSDHLSAWYGQVLIGASVFSLYFHLCNGIRHLFWDVGMGFEIKTAELSAWLVIVVAVLLTGLSLYIGMVI